MYLYDHLWLLDPSWERVTGTSVMEQTLTKELKQINPDAASGARIDIAFKTVSGKHVIIEMKRPKVHPDIMNLVAQGNKYVQATTQWFSNNPKIAQWKYTAYRSNIPGLALDIYKRTNTL